MELNQLTSAALLAAATLALPATAKAVVPEYTLLDLGTPGGTRSEACGLNNAGQVVGWGKTADGSNRAFRTAPNTPINPATDLLPLIAGGTANFAYAISAAGDVAGYSPAPTADRAFRYTAGTLTTLPTLGGAWNYANAINARGDVVGGAALGKPAGSPPTHAALYSGSSAYDLQTLTGQDSYAYAINTAGTVAGYRQLPAVNGTTYEHAFIWIPSVTNGTSGTMTDLASLGGNYSYAWGINDSSVIVGSSTTLNDAASHAFRWTPSVPGSATGTMSDLGTLPGGAASEAFAANTAGHVVGDADTPATTHAFVHIDGTMYDLNDHLTPAAAGWVLTTARAINDVDQIAGTGTTPTGDTHAFLLTPKPTWNVDADGLWSAASNWIGVLPSGTGAEAQFTTAITAPRTVTLDSPRTLGKLLFNSTVPYTLVGSPLTLSAPAGTPSVDVRAGGHTLAAPLNLGTRATLSLAAGAALKLSGPVSGTLSSLFLGTGATLDLTDNDLILEYDATGGSPLASIRAAVASGYNGGTWTGTGIASSSAAVQPASATALACVEASDAGMTSINGNQLTGPAVLLKYTYYGDANLDGKVNADDFALVDRGFANHLTGWLNGDFNYDGSVTSADYLLIDRVYAQQTGVLSPSLLTERETQFGPDYVAALVAAAPEPSGAAILALAAAVPVYRPRRWPRCRSTRV